MDHAPAIPTCLARSLVSAPSTNNRCCHTILFVSDVAKRGQHDTIPGSL